MCLIYAVHIILSSQFKYSDENNVRVCFEIYTQALDIISSMFKNNEMNLWEMGIFNLWISFLILVHFWCLQLKRSRNLSLWEHDVIDKFLIFVELDICIFLEQSHGQYFQQPNISCENSIHNRNYIYQDLKHLTFLQY